MTTIPAESQLSAIAEVERFRQNLGPFVAAVETTRMPMVFTDGQDAEHPIVYANDALLALTGHTRAAILGAPISRLLGSAADSAAVSSIAAVMAAGDRGIWVLPCHGAGSRVFPASVAVRPVRDTDGVVRQHCVSFFEIDRYGNGTEGLPKVAHALYEDTPGFIALAEGPDHRFTYANAAYKRLVVHDRLVGLTVNQAMPELAEQGIIALLDNVYRTGEKYVAKGKAMTFVHPDTGEAVTRLVDFIYQPVRDAEGIITGIFCEGYDVTAHHRAVAELSVLQAEMIHDSRINALGTMATMLGHELNQPLSAISNYATAMQRIVDPAMPHIDQLFQAMEGIGEAARRAGDIIHNLRDLTRRRLSDKSVFDLKSAVDACIRLVRVTASPDIRIVDTGCEGMTILGDKVQIQQVIINLLLNACEAMATTDRRDMSISAREEGDHTVVCVTDQGPGVSVEAQENLFAWRNSSKMGGMGLGLSICRTIVEAHQGRIWLANSSPAGAVFCFMVPRAMLR